VFDCFSDHYNVGHLENNLMQALEKVFPDIETAEIADIDKVLLSLIFCLTRDENLRIMRNTKPLCGGLLKGRPRE
jgi:uncharacterized protein YcbK (DUF882 family)